MTTAILIILLYLYGPHHLILHLVKMDDCASLIVDFLELHRIDPVTLLEEVRYFLTLANRGTNKEGQKENDAGVLTERNGGCSSNKLEHLPMIRI